MKLTVLLTAACLCLFSVSCLKKDSYSCNFEACALVATAAEIQEVEAYIAANAIVGAVKHCSGMYYQIVTAGTGNEATACSNVAASYKGTLKNGTVFTDVTTPDIFSLGQVIRGWTIGVPLIKEGGKIRLFIPGSLAYGAAGRTDANGQVIIPPNAMLIFDISLVAASR